MNDDPRSIRCDLMHMHWEQRRLVVLLSDLEAEGEATTGMEERLRLNRVDVSRCLRRLEEAMKDI